MDKNTLYEKYGFSQWATLNRNGSRIIQFMDKLGINLFVDFETGEFYMKWLIPKSIFTIECPRCSPISNIAHFEKMYDKFKQIVLSQEVNHG